jgi:hypothetical protein
MEFVKKLIALFKPQPVVTPTPLVSDAEFLDYVAEVARRRTRLERGEADAATTSGPAPTQQAA